MGLAIYMKSKGEYTSIYLYYTGGSYYTKLDKLYPTPVNNLQCTLLKFQMLNVFSPLPGWLWSSIKVGQLQDKLWLALLWWQLPVGRYYRCCDVVDWWLCIELPVPSLQVIIGSLSILLKDAPQCRRKLLTIQPSVLKAAQKTIHWGSVLGFCCFSSL